MASTIVETVGAANANSYVSMAEASTYFSNRLYDDNWVNAGASDKAAALLWATRLLDTRVTWNGEKASTTQALAWPRKNVYASEQPAYGPPDYLDDTTIPLFIKDAQCEYALALLGGDVTQDPSSVGLNAVSVGSLSVQYNAGQKPEVVPRPVRDLVRDYGTVASSNGTATLIRG